MANYYGTNSNGRTLMHYRTKGSRNGYSKDPNYRPVGQQAQGKIINGRYVYDNPTAQRGGPSTHGVNTDEAISRISGEIRNRRLSPQARENGIQSMQKGYRNNWQQQGNYARAGGEAINRAVAGQTRGVRMKINSAQENQAIAGMTAKARRDLSKAGAKNNWQQQANATAGINRPMNDRNVHVVNVTGRLDEIDEGKMRKETPMQRYRGSTGLNMNSVHNAQTERARHEALESVVNGVKGGIIKNRDQVASGFAKNIQDRIRTANPYGEQKNVGGAMRNDPRYSSNSVVGTVSGNMNKQELAAIGSTVKGAYNKIAHPIDRQVNKLKGTAAKATREVKKTASNVVNKGKATVNNLLKKFKKKK